VRRVPPKTASQSLICICAWKAWA